MADPEPSEPTPNDKEDHQTSADEVPVEDPNESQETHGTSEEMEVKPDPTDGTSKSESTADKADTAVEADSKTSDNSGEDTLVKNKDEVQQDGEAQGQIQAINTAENNSEQSRESERTENVELEKDVVEKDGNEKVDGDEAVTHANCDKENGETISNDNGDHQDNSNTKEVSSDLNANKDSKITEPEKEGQSNANPDDAISNSEKQDQNDQQVTEETSAPSNDSGETNEDSVHAESDESLKNRTLEADTETSEPISRTEDQTPSNAEAQDQTTIVDTPNQTANTDAQDQTSNDDTHEQEQADSVPDASTAKSDISEPAVSITKGSDKVVTFEDIKSGLDDTTNESEPPKSPTSTIFRELAASRQSERTYTTTGTEFLYDDDDADFPTPDFYDKALQYTPTPPVPESVKSRQESGLRRNLVSRGESNKSVTFADEVKKDADDDAEEQEEDGRGEQEEEDAEGDGDNNKVEEELAAITDKPSTEEFEAAEEEESVFATAVSEDKIEEATARSKKKLADTQSVAVDLWGQSSYTIESMGNVVTKRATEHFEKGCRLADNEHHCQAILAFDKAINLCPKIVTYYLARGESYIQICDFQSAILNLKKACVLDPDCDKYYSKLAFVYYFYGQTLFDQNLFAEALEAFSRASEMRPEVVGYHTRSVACLAALQRHGECLALVNKRLEMEQDNADLYIMRARLHELFRNTSLCYYDLRDALALDPDQEEAVMMMKKLEEKAVECRNHSVQLQLQGKLKDALNKITTAIETNPSIPEYHLLRGALHRRLQDYNAAIDDYLLALDKTEHNEQDQIYTESQRQLLLTYNDFAVECFCGKHYEEAIILLNKALKGEKREKGLYINRGDCFFRLNELHFALADYHQSLELDQEDSMIRSRIASIHNEFGLLDYEEHSYQEAEARFTVAIQHNPRMGSYYIYRAKVRFMLENQPGARQDLLMALHLDPSNDEILSLLPRLFPGKSVGDVMRSKQARTAKLAIDNAVVTASPVKLPEIKRDIKVAQQGGAINGTSKHVAFASDGVPPREPSMPDIRACMSETTFNKVIAKNKKKVSDHVKSLLHDRRSLSNGSPISLAPQPPPRPYAVKGGGLRKGDDDRPQGWQTFSLGMGIMNK